MRFEYWQTDEGSWTWQLISPMGDTLARGVPSPSRELCLMAIKLVKLGAGAQCRELYAAPAVSAPPFAVSDAAPQSA